MNNKKLNLVIITITVISFGSGFYLSSFQKVPASELIFLQEKLAGWEEAQEDYGLNWVSYNLEGRIAEIKENIVYIEGEPFDLEYRPIYREAVVTEDTSIVLREIAREEIAEWRLFLRDKLLFTCEHLTGVDWDPEAIELAAIELLDTLDPEAGISQKPITLKQIKPGDQIEIWSLENIAPTIRFEASTIYIDRF